MTEQHQEEALGLGLATHTMVLSLARVMIAKGLLTQEDLDSVAHESLTVLETAVPDRDAVRSARLILEHMLVAQPLAPRRAAFSRAG